MLLFHLEVWIYKFKNIPQRWAEWSILKKLYQQGSATDLLKKWQKFWYHVVESIGWFSKDVKGESEYRRFLWLK